MPTRGMLADELAADMRAEGRAYRSTTIAGEPGCGRTHLLGLVYDRLVAEDGGFWPLRDEGWAGFPTRLAPAAESEPTFLWLGAPCAEANGLPLPAIARLGQQLEATTSAITGLLGQLRDLVLSLTWQEVAEAASAMTIENLPGGAMTIRVLRALRRGGAIVAEALERRRGDRVIDVLDEDFDALVTSLLATITAIAHDLPVVLAVDDAEHADPALAALLARLAAARPQGVHVLLATAQQPLAAGSDRRIELGPLPRADARRIVAAAAPGTPPDVADLVAAHVGGHARDLVDLQPLLAERRPRTAADVAALPRRRRAAAEFAWLQSPDADRRATAAIAWLAHEAGAPISIELATAAVADAEVPPRLPAGWVGHAPEGLVVPDALHREIALARFGPADRATVAERVLEHLDGPVDDRDPATLAAHVAAATAWMDAEPGPIVDGAAARRLQRAADAALALFEIRRRLRAPEAALRSYDVAERIARELGATAAELAVLSSYRADALANAGRLAQAREVMRRALDAPGLTGAQRRGLEGGAAAIDAETTGDPAETIEAFEQRLVDLDRAGAGDSAEALQARLGIARQRSRAGDALGAAAVYAGAAAWLEARPELAQELAASMGPTASSIRRSAAAALRAADDPTAAAAQLEAAAEQTADAGERAQLRRWANTDRLSDLLRRQGSQEAREAFARTLATTPDGPGPPLAAVLSRYVLPDEHLDRVAVGLGHATGLLLVGRWPDAEPLLDDLAEHVAHLDPLSHLRVELAYRRVHLACVRGDGAARAMQDTVAAFVDAGADDQHLSALLTVLLLRLHQARLAPPALAALNELRNHACQAEDVALELLYAQLLAQGARQAGMYAQARDIAALYVPMLDEGQPLWALFRFVQLRSAWDDGDPVDDADAAALLDAMSADHPLRPQVERWLEEVRAAPF